LTTLILLRVEERLVGALKERARRHGRSAETEHRAILASGLTAKAPSREEMLAYFRLGTELGLGEVEIGRTGGGPAAPPDLG
jgi:plasmid stability protein